MNRAEAIQSAFVCPKCRGKSAHVEQAAITLTGGRFFPLRPGRFLVVTCTLCGYTEFYDTSAFAESREAKTARAEASAPTPLTPIAEPQKGG